MYGLNRMLFILMRETRRRHLSPQRQERVRRLTTIESTPLYAEFLHRLEVLRHERQMARAAAAPAGSRYAAFRSRVGTVQQPQGQRADPDRAMPAAVSSDRRPPTLSGWYFYADGQLHEGYLNLETMQADLDQAAVDNQTISEVRYHD